VLIDLALEVVQLDEILAPTVSPSHRIILLRVEASF
jgi:hypothetical protein